MVEKIPRPVPLLENNRRYAVAFKFMGAGKTCQTCSNYGYLHLIRSLMRLSRLKVYIPHLLRQNILKRGGNGFDGFK